MTTYGLGRPAALLAALALAACSIPDRTYAPPPDAGPPVDSALRDGTVDSALPDGTVDSAPPDAAWPADGADANPVSPSFSLSYSPAAPVRLIRDSTAGVTINVLAAGGFVGPVTVSASKLPSGVAADSLVVVPGAATATLTLRATKDATQGVDGSFEIQGISGSVVSPVVSIPIIVQDPAGTLDTTFGSGGVATVSVPGASIAALGAHGLVIQNDGRIVFCGLAGAGAQSLLVGRLTKDGAADPNFASGGFMTSNSVGFTYEVGQSIQPVADGGLAVAGFGYGSGANHQMFAVKLVERGGFDTNFGGGTGVLAISDGTVDAKAYDIVVQPSDGKLVVGGFLPYGSPALVRVTAVGEEDSTFDPPPTGSATVGVNTYANAGGQINALGLLPNGDILASMESAGFLAARFTSHGAIDPTYGDAGTAAMGVVGASGASEVLLQPGGASVYVGSTSTTIELAGLDANGALNGQFGTNGGRTSTPISGSSSVKVSSAAMMPDGRFVVAGQFGPQATLGVARYTALGTLDTTFAAGLGYTGVASVAQALTVAVAVDGVGRVVVAAGGNGTVTLARFWE